MNCAACSRNIDAAAKTCPYCGANPVTGERVDTDALLQEMFKPKEMTKSASVLEYARQRQGLVVFGGLVFAFLLVALLHQWASSRNSNAVSDAPAVPLSELTDVTNRPDETQPAPLPALDFEFDGRPNTMRTFIVEPGATTPPEVVAQQQAAQQANAAATGNPAAARPGAAPAPAPSAVPPGAQPARPATPQPQQPQAARPPR
jgi:hypothetical protein